MAIDSKLMYGTYVYPFPPDPLNPNRGDVGTIAYDDGVPSLTVHKGVRTTYSSGTPTNIGPDPKPLYFKNGAGLNRAAVASIVWVGTVATCTWLVYEADADNTTPFTWNDPVAGPVILTIGGVKTVTNPYALKTREVSSGVVDIYCIDYDGKFIFRVRSSGVNGDTYTVQNGYYEFAGVNGNDSFGVDLEITDDYLYALFINGTNLSEGAPNANYLNSTVVKLDFGLGTPPLAYIGPYTSTTTGSGFPAKNAFSIQAYNDGSNEYLLLTAVGGPQLDQIYLPNYPQNWNPESRIQSVDPGTLAVTDLLRAAANTGEPATDQFDFRALTFSDDGSQAYILTGKFNPSFASFSYRLYWTDMSILTSASNALVSDLVAALPPEATIVDTNAAASGFLWGLEYSESTVKTWFVKGEDLAIYDVNVPGQVVSAGGITALSSLPAGDFPGLNFVTIYEDEVATPVALKAYVAPAFASVSSVALAERERFLKEVAAAQEKK